MKKKSSDPTVRRKSQFALDIGTRSVVGMLGSIHDQSLVIEQAAMVFHGKRAMFDGQIHDIEGVAQVVRQVKEELEKASGLTLSEVTIAAAGRALKTVTIEADLRVDELAPVNQAQIHQVELEALQRAQQQLQQELEEETRYFCVGHSVIHYALDAARLTNPLGHHGRRLSVHLIATFLPKMVVDSLYAAVTKAGLEVAHMTLEPIAAIEVAVPENARLLNIALVDVGAGTSDLAVTRDGTIIAYGMSSVAGDEITELLAKEEMLDFDQAENLKCQLAKQDQHHYLDILGLEHQESTETLLKKLKPAIETVADEISANILEKNERKPSAVFLIGGGSQIPGLAMEISHRLELPKERVAVRNIGHIPGLDYRPSLALGPEGVTPIGILKKALLTHQKDFFEVEVNGQQVRLFQTRKLRVKDALAAIQYDPQKLVPRRGDGLEVIVNDEPVMLYGEYGEAAEIEVNGKKANLETEIKPADRILIIPASIGSARKAVVEELLPPMETCTLDGKQVSLVVNLTRNGKTLKEVTDALHHGDVIGYQELYTVEDIWRYYKFQGSVKNVRLNGEKAEPQMLVQKGDILTTHQENDVTIPDAEGAVFSKSESESDGDSKGSGRQGMRIQKQLTLRYNGSDISISSKKQNLVFIDIFDHIDFDRSNVKGKLVLSHNGQPAEYTAPLRPGDDIWIYWDQEETASLTGKKDTAYDQKGKK